MAAFGPKVSRRTMLRGAGAALALPFLESLLPRVARAAAVAQPPIRMGIFTVTGGTVLESWRPKEAGPLGTLPSILRPLEPVKDNLLVVSGLSNHGRTDNLNGHEACAFTHLTAAPLAKKEGGKIYAGPSIDQVVAEVVGRETLLPSLEMGLSNQETRYSFRRGGNLPYEANPRLVFDRMFRGRPLVAPDWQRRASASAAGDIAAVRSPDRSVIDAVLEETRSLRGAAGRDDRQKLDRYLDSVRSVEKRIDFLELRQREDLLDVAAAEKSGDRRRVLREPAGLPPEGTSIWQVTKPVHDDSDKHAEYIRLMAELMVLAFQTDTTRVATLAAGSDEAMFHGVVTVGSERHCHTLEHQGNAGRPEDADPISREACRQIHAWYTSLFAEMILKMRDIDEGGSSLLDNSMILYTSYMADGGHGRDNYPALLAGRAQGKFKTGQHVAFDNKAPMANLYIEMAERMGVALDTFGDSHVSQYAGALNGRLPGMV